MPFFSFKVIPKIAKHKNISDKIRDKWVILEKDVTGIITINEEAEYHVILDTDDIIDILESNYKCKGQVTIYSQLLYNKNLTRIIIHRHKEQLCESFPNLPFCVGAIVKGDIIFNNDTALKYFKIKKCAIDNTNAKAISIFKDFREKYHLLKDKILSKINEYNPI